MGVESRLMRGVMRRRDLWIGRWWILGWILGLV